MSDSEIRINLLRENGAHIGAGSKYFSDHLPIKRDCPLLYIGDNVTIASDVSFILHDNAVSKYSAEYTDLIGKITIGDNSFIGHGSIVLLGVSVPPESIVAAGSVVSNSFEKKRCVIAGNPAKIIGTVDEYFKKNENKMFNLDGMTNLGVAGLIEEQPNKLVRRKIKGIE